MTNPTAPRSTADLDVDAIQARCDAATAGPWSFEQPTQSRLRFYVGECCGWFIYPATNSIWHGTTARDDARFIAHAREDIPALLAEVRRLRALINTPQTDAWTRAVELEAAHQIERWGVDHDEGKSPQDWFWLLGWLAGKAVHAAVKGDVEKARHHTISSGAVLLNWWRQLSGISNRMRPGIAPPDEIEGASPLAKGAG